jgi:hypothetical protein
MKEIAKKSTEGNRMRTLGYRLLFGLCIYFVAKRLPLKSLAKYARIKA